MAHSLSAKKRIRQNAKQQARNRWRKDQIKQVRRAFDEALHDGNIDEAEKQLRNVFQKLDKVAAKGTIHKNAASRTKSRLSKRLEQARA